MILKKPKNRENNREFSKLAPKTSEFCPKSANFALKQGINREVCGYLTETRVNAGQFRVYSGIQKINREFSRCRAYISTV
jgi:hypothetical protein